MLESPKKFELPKSMTQTNTGRKSMTKLRFSLNNLEPIKKFPQVSSYTQKRNNLNIQNNPYEMKSRNFNLSSSVSASNLKMLSSKGFPSSEKNIINQSMNFPNQKIINIKKPIIKSNDHIISTQNLGRYFSHSKLET